jgi:uncharacterized membrane protein
MRHFVFATILVAGGAVQLGCGSSSPVAPTGTLLTLSANPDRIATNGTSIVTATARRPNGTPAFEGTIVRFTTTLGIIDSSVEVDAEGVARAVLRGGGAVGMARVSATTGASDEVTIDVQIGILASSLSLQATPATVSEFGGQLELLAIVRDDRGQALSAAGVNFKTDVGSLLSGGSLVATDDRGEARDTLAVTSGDLDPVTGDTFRVAVETANGSGSIINADATITIQRRPRADFTALVQGLRVTFTDTSTGRPTSWRWEFGDGNTSTLQNPAHAYAAAGTYLVNFTATNSQASDTISKFVAVTGQ